MVASKLPTIRQIHSVHVEATVSYLPIGPGCHTSVITNDASDSCFLLEKETCYPALFSFNLPAWFVCEIPSLSRERSLRSLFRRRQSLRLPLIAPLGTGIPNGSRK